MAERERDITLEEGMNWIQDLMARSNELTRLLLAPSCNDCGWKLCKYRPDPGETVRINCPLWKEME